jgi:hypothetical protein
MTQRATQTRSGTSGSPTAPHPDWPLRLPTDPGADAGEVVNEPSALERAGPAASETPPAEPPEVEHLSRSESQRAARSERRFRRRLAIACALLVAGCLVVTILIVELARTRAAGLPAPGSASALVVSFQPQPPPATPTTRSFGADGATAPEGGHP